MADIELRGEIGAGGPLDTVNGPEGGGIIARGVVRVVNNGDGREGLGMGVVGGKGDVVERMPVAGGNAESKGQGEEKVDDWGDGAAVGDLEGAVLD